MRVTSEVDFIAEAGVAAVAAAITITIPTFRVKTANCGVGGKGKKQHLQSERLSRIVNRQTENHDKHFKGALHMQVVSFQKKMASCKSKNLLFTIKHIHKFYLQLKYSFVVNWAYCAWGARSYEVGHMYNRI